MYRKGLLLSLVGVLILSFDAPLVRLIGADGLTVVIWRGLLMTVAFLSFALFNHDYRSRLFVRPSVGSLVAAALFGGSTVLFVLTAKLIPVSSVLTMVATIPLVAAFLSWIVLKEALQSSLVIAAVGTLVGVALVMQGDWNSGEPIGYLLGGITVFAFGGYLTVLRSHLKPHVPQALGMAGLLAAGIGLVAGGSTVVPVEDWPYVAALGLIVVPVSFALLSAGARYILAADVGLIMTLELVVGVIWGSIFLGENLTPVSFLGVVIVLAALVYRTRAYRLSSKAFQS